MEVVGDQSPSVTEGLGFFDDGFQAAEEFISVRIVMKDRATFDATADDVM
jgi:hypothetical protein